MIITLIGSKRFQPWFDMWQEVLNLTGHTTHIMISFDNIMLGKNKRNAYFINDTIKSSDAVMLINQFAYIGEQTLKELNYAIELNKTIIALDSW